MAMDPKQERALRDGTASQADRPRRTDRQSVREQEENPPVTNRPSSRRPTTAVADVRVNLESGTPVEQLARELGAEQVPELGRTRRNKRDDTGDDTEASGESRDDAPIELPATERADQRPEAAPSVSAGEARRTLKARRDHSKGDGNFPRVEPGPELLDERPEDRKPRDLPKARDDRSAPKGNVTLGQEERIADAKNAGSSSPRKKPAAARAKRGTKSTTAGRGRAAGGRE